MTVLFIAITLLGGFFSPYATVPDALYCITDWPGGWYPETCAIEFSDNIPVVGELLQNRLRENWQNRVTQLSFEIGDAELFPSGRQV